jgi:hypothetical protein
MREEVEGMREARRYGIKQEERKPKSEGGR